MDSPFKNTILLIVFELSATKRMTGLGLGPNGELFGVSRASVLIAGAGIFRDGIFAGILTTNGGTAEEAAFAKEVSTGENLTFLFFRNALTFYIRGTYRMITGKFRHRMLAAKFLVSTGHALMAARRLRPKIHRAREEK